jgi:hypothetical protein
MHHILNKSAVAIRAMISFLIGATIRTLIFTVVLHMRSEDRRSELEGEKSV